MTTQQADEETLAPCDVVLKAEQLIRHDHTVSDPMWRFWSNVADWMNRQQSRARYELIKTSAEWGEFHKALAAAYDYIDNHEQREKHCADPQCDGRQITMQVFPCDGISVLGELRRRIQPDVLKIVGNAIVSAS